jgi:hypothetical protein
MIFIRAFTENGALQQAKGGADHAVLAKLF